MATFNVGLWISQLQYNENGFTVRNTVDNYLEGSTSDVPQTINGVRKSGVYGIPTECPGTSFTALYPCDRSFEITYNNLLPWWDDFTRCDNLPLEADSNLLITDCDRYCGGGRAYVFGKKAYANGNNIEKLSNSFVNYEAGCSAYSMSTAFQEIGHNLMNGPRDGGDGDNAGQHDTGRTFNRPDGWAVSPMSAGYWDSLAGANECGNRYHDPTNNLQDFNYSACARSYFTKK